MRLGVRPIPGDRTIERALRRHGSTAPRVRPAPLPRREEYPGPQPRASDRPHEVDRAGPVDLMGGGPRSDIRVCAGALYGAVRLRLAGSRRTDEVLGSLGECRKDLGRPERVQSDGARELAGWGPAARTLSQVIWLRRRFGVGTVLIPEGEPQCRTTDRHLTARPPAVPADFRGGHAVSEESPSGQNDAMSVRN
jgi:hypothetical protein